MVSLDATLWPANAKMLSEAVKTLSNVLHMSSANLAHVQLPVHHAATSHSAIMNHARRLEDMLLNQQLDLQCGVTLLFCKDDSARSDKRKVTQQCHAVSTKQFRSDSVWNNSTVVQNGYIPNLQLIKVTEMVGYDEFSKPTPGARVEQRLC